MTTSNRLLLASILAAVLMAPPAFSQSTKEQLNTLTSDILNLTNAVKQMQASADQRYAELARQNTDNSKLLEQILTRFTSIDSSIQKLATSIDGTMKTNAEKTSRDIQEIRTAITALKDSLAPLAQLSQLSQVNEGINNLQNQMRGLKTQINEMKVSEAPLPTATSLYNNAYSQLQQGYYDFSINDFNDFLRTYPNDERAAGAHVEIGNALFALRKFDQAIQEYDLAYQNYPKSDKRCTALFKKGLTHVELQETPKATTVFQSVVKDCPNEADLAKDKLKALEPKKPGYAGKTCTEAGLDLEIHHGKID